MSTDATSTGTTATDAALARLLTARATRTPCAPVRDLLPPDDVDAAYAVQSHWVSGRVAAGARVLGRKIGLTNPLVQAQLGVDRPDYGFLLDDMLCPPGIAVDLSNTLQPRIETEIAFVLSRDLTLASPSAEDVLAATSSVVAALEIVDSRIAGWDIDIVDTVADNASSGLFALGARCAPDGLDLAACAMSMRRGSSAGSEVVSTGTGAACLGHPLAAVAWLAATAVRHGHPLRAGEIVLSGALGPMVPVVPGDEFHAEITGIGTVSVTFADGPS